MARAMVDLFGTLAILFFIVLNASNFGSAVKAAAGATGGLFNSVVRGQSYSG